MTRATWCLAAALVLLSPVHAPAGGGAGEDWESLSKGALTVRYQGESDILAKQVLEKAAVFIEDTAPFFGIEAVGPYHIVIAADREQFVELQPTSTPAPEWAGALTYPGLGLVLIMTPGAMQTGGARYWSLLQHEVAHLLLGDAQAAHRTSLPRWLQEGLATYVAGEMTLSRLLHLGWALVSGSAPPFEELQSTFPEQPALAEAAYARSYLFVRYLTARFGDDAIADFLAASLRHGDISEGAAEAFGSSLAEIMRGFDRYARVRAAWLPALSSTASVWGLITLLFLFTAWRKRVHSARVLERWDEEERALAGYDRSRSERDEEKRPTIH